MLEHIHGVPQRIANLKAKLKARDGKKEFAKNCEDIRAEIARLEAVSANKEALAEFVASEGPLASGASEGDVT